MEVFTQGSEMAKDLAFLWRSLCFTLRTRIWLLEPVVAARWNPLTLRLTCLPCKLSNVLALVPVRCLESPPSIENSLGSYFSELVETSKQVRIMSSHIGEKYSSHLHICNVYGNEILVWNCVWESGRLRLYVDVSVRVSVCVIKKCVENTP